MVIDDGGCALAQDQFWYADTSWPGFAKSSRVNSYRPLALLAGHGSPDKSSLRNFARAARQS
jgi:hypothetical protein